MPTQITLGNAYQSNGRTVIGGSQSGFDIKSLVDSLATAKAQPATILTDKNKKLDSQISAFGTLKTLLSSFQSAADTLRNQPGVNNASKTVFQYRTTSLSTSDGSAAANYASVAAEPGAQIQSFSIDKITQLARETKQQTNTINVADSTTASAVSATPGAGQLGAGTITLKATDGGANVAITLNAGDSLQTVANDFNQVSNRTGIQANIIQVGTGAYKLTFTGTKTGAANGFDLTNPATVISDPSGALANLTISTPQTAQDSKFTIDGVDIQRSTNSVSDVFNGVTITLQQSTLATGTVVKANIVPDTSIASTAINSFVDAYNNFKLFVSNQSQRNDDGSPKDTSVLINDVTLRALVDEVNTQLTTAISGITGSDPTRLEDIGVSFSDFAGDDKNPATKNILTVNTDKLNSALSTNFNGVANLFEYNLTADNAALSTYSVAKNLSVSSFQVVINRSGAGTYQAIVGGNTINLTATPIGSSGSLNLTGPAGSVLEGLQLLYSSPTDATINVTIAQGFGDRLYNTLNNAIDATKGTITQAVKAISDQESRNKDEIAKINDNVASYRDQITQKYAELESALTKANSLLQLLQAQSDARNNSR